MVRIIENSDPGRASQKNMDSEDAISMNRAKMGLLEGAGRGCLPGGRTMASLWDSQWAMIFMEHHI